MKPLALILPIGLLLAAVPAYCQQEPSVVPDQSGTSVQSGSTPVPAQSSSAPIRTAPVPYGTAQAPYGYAPAQYGYPPAPYGYAQPQYGNAPPQYAGSAPPPRYGSAPAPQYGTAPAPQYGNAPPQYGSAPPPQYGNAPPRQYSNAPLPQYGNAPAPQYGTAPPPQYGNAPAPQYVNAAPQYGNAPPQYGNAPVQSGNPVQYGSASVQDHSAPVKSGGGSGMLQAGVEQNALQSGAEENMNGPQTPLMGTIPHNRLNGQVDDPNNSASNRLNAQIHEDPDGKNPELMLAWDKWRNHFAHSIWQKFCETLDPGLVFLGKVPVRVANTRGSGFPQGLHAVYTCTITNDRRVTSAEITRSSGDPRFDAIILDCVRSMDGKHSLEFPKGSARDAVHQRDGLSTGPSGWHNRTYGDVEHVSQQSQPQQ